MVSTNDITYYVNKTNDNTSPLNLRMGLNYSITFAWYRPFWLSSFLACPIDFQPGCLSICWKSKPVHIAVITQARFLLPLNDTLQFGIDMDVKCACNMKLKIFSFWKSSKNFRSKKILWLTLYIINY